MKVMLLAVNASWTHSCLALYYLRNAIADLQHDIIIRELTLKQSVSEALETIQNEEPDVLCLSVYIWNIEYYKQLVPDCRKLLQKLLIVAGGPEVTFNQKSAAALNPDFLIKGAGEKAFRRLAELGFKSDCQIWQGEAEAFSDLAFPYQSRDAERLKGRMLYYESSRGCAFSCSYCLSAASNKYEQLPAARVCHDIDLLLELHPKVIKFVDRSFNQDAQRARIILKYVISLTTNVPFHFEIHPDLLTETDLELIKTAPPGRIQFETGIQSIHPETLKRINRPSDWNNVRQNLSALNQIVSIPVHADLIIGLPGENLTMLKASVNEVLKTFPDELQLGLLKILAHTPMHEYAQEHGYIWSETAPYGVLQTTDLSFADIQHLDRIALVINQFWNRGDFPTVWSKAILLKAPFSCLESLLKLLLDSQNQLHSIDKNRRFEIMATWIDSFWEGEEQTYLTDALKWDWCRKAGESWYPKGLKGEAGMSFRKEHYQELVEWLKTEYWDQEDWNLKRFIVFSASSSEFSREFLEGYSKALFISREKPDNACVIYTKQF